MCQIAYNSSPNRLQATTGESDADSYNDRVFTGNGGCLTLEPCETRHIYINCRHIKRSSSAIKVSWMLLMREDFTVFVMQAFIVLRLHSLQSTVQQQYNSFSSTAVRLCGVICSF